MNDLVEASVGPLPEQLPFPFERAADARRRELVRHIEGQRLAPQRAGPPGVWRLVGEPAAELAEGLKVDRTHLARVVRRSPDRVHRLGEERWRHAGMAP